MCFDKVNVTELIQTENLLRFGPVVQQKGCFVEPNYFLLLSIAAKPLSVFVWVFFPPTFFQLLDKKFWASVRKDMRAFIFFQLKRRMRLTVDCNIFSMRPFPAAWCSCAHLQQHPFQRKNRFSILFIITLLGLSAKFKNWYKVLSFYFWLKLKHHRKGVYFWLKWFN